MPTIKKISLNGVPYDLGDGLTEDVKQASLQIAEKVAYIDEHGQDYYDELYTAFYDNMWNVTNTLSNASTSNPATKTAKDGTYTAIISANTGYTLDGATVSVTMNGANITSSVYNNGTINIPTVTGDVVITVVAVALTVVSISAVYTQSGTVYDTDSLDSLKSDLVVIATFNDSSVSVVPSDEYTLSGTLAVGTSTVTVTYGGFTTTFTVTVTSIIPDGYTRVQYLASSANAAGTQSYINTGITFNSPTLAKFRVIFSEDSDANGTCYVIGVRETGTGATNNIGWGVRVMNHTQIDSWSSSPGASITGAEAFSVFDVTATWKSNRLTVREGSGTEVVASQTTRSITAGYPICLFGLKYAAGASGGSPYPIKGKIFYAKAEQDGTTLLECYPVVRDSDSKPGFYDIKNNAFYAPYGNYITAGPEV